jgi:hypothetical protein
MCSTFYVDDEGLCAEGFTSLKKGSVCQVKSDCMDSRGKEYLCSCSSTGASLKYCDIGPEDKEWKTAR